MPVATYSLEDEIQYLKNTLGDKARDCGCHKQTLLVLLNELKDLRLQLYGSSERCYDQIKYHNYFSIPTGKKYGDAIERQILKSFNGFQKSLKDTSFDAWTKNGEKIEVKSLRARARNGNGIFFKSDVVSSSKFSTTSFQQTKPSCCDWFIFHILYGDGSRLFVVPSSMISKHPGSDKVEEGKLPLSIQHRGHNDEGQVNLGQVIKYAKFFEINGYDIDSTYEFSKFQREVEFRLAKINWKLPPG